MTDHPWQRGVLGTPPSRRKLGGRIEVHRTLARLHHEGRLNNNGWAEALQRFQEIEQGILWIPLTPRVSAVAAGPFPTVLKALDAIHLASAAFVRETSGPDLTFATHDRQLGTAAVALGFAVVGAQEPFGIP